MSRPSVGIPRTPRSSLRTGLSMSVLSLGETPYTSRTSFACLRMDLLPGGQPQTPPGSLRSGLRMGRPLQKLASMGIRLSYKGQSEASPGGTWC